MTEKQHLTASGARVGLVLSGGGAKGAYQVGVIKCLADHDIKLHAVAGASVGALNGAVVASSPNLREAASRLETIWTQIARQPPAEITKAKDMSGAALSFSLRLLFVSTGRGDLALLSDLLALARRSRPPGGVTNDYVSTLVEEFDIGDDASLAGIINQCLDEEALIRGLPFYVSVFRSSGAIIDLAWVAAGLSNLADTPDSEFIHVQSQERAAFKRCVLASAALPLIFEAQSIRSHLFIDGGIGGWLKVQGNTPVTPLVIEAGCQYVIVTHLNDGSLWDRHRFPNVVALEIRPGKPIKRKGGLLDTLSFDPPVIAEWIQQGYEDTERCISTSGHALEIVSAGRKAQQRVQESLRKLCDNDSSSEY